MLRHTLRKLGHARFPIIVVGVGVVVALGVSAVAALTPIDAHSLAAARASTPPVGRAAAPAATTITPKGSCATLATDDFTGIPDTITSISSATTGTFNGGQYCEVTGYISPQTQFQVDLPVSTWQGNYLQEGCGGRCGAVKIGTPYQSSGCVQMSGNNLVLASDDMGHTGLSATDSAWAANNADLRAVFGISSEHSLATAAKAIIRAYYGTGPSHSYYDGCSNGGKEAMDEAEYYPKDFNGIIAGSPVLFYAQDNAELHGWEAAVNTNAQGQDILTPAKLPALHTAVIKACGNAQGLIVDPRKCDFNPASIQCPAGSNNNSCLTPAQVTVVKDFYTGPVLPNGRGNLYPSGVPYGSELAWAGTGTTLIAPAGKPEIDSWAGKMAIGYLKYMGFPTDPSSSYTLADFKFDRAGFDSLKPEEYTYNTTNPDLSAFRAAGGKLIMYDGWAADSTPPFSTLDYYRTMAKYMGGYQASQSFSRLYMVPGAGHCLDAGAGDLNVSPDFLTAMMNWVQDGQAPGSYTLPVTDAVAPTTVSQLTIAPYNPFTVVKGDGLNSNYHYIGKIAPGVDTGSPASIPPGAAIDRSRTRFGPGRSARAGRAGMRTGSATTDREVGEASRKRVHAKLPAAFVTVGQLPIEDSGAPPGTARRAVPGQ